MKKSIFMIIMVLVAVSLFANIPSRNVTAFEITKDGVARHITTVSVPPGVNNEAVVNLPVVKSIQTSGDAEKLVLVDANTGEIIFEYGMGFCQKCRKWFRPPHWFCSGNKDKDNDDDNDQENEN